MPTNEGIAVYPLVDLPKDPAGCWTWKGYHNNAGVPMKQRGGKPVAARRWLWEALLGKVPDGMEVFGVCGNRSCVAIHHSKMGEPGDVVRSNVATKFDWSEVARMKRLEDLGWFRDRIAAEFGTTPEYVGRIITGKRWTRKKPTRT